jgi:hypothetical protein
MRMKEDKPKVGDEICPRSIGFILSGPNNGISEIT